MTHWLTTRRAVPLVIWLALLTGIGVLLGSRSTALPTVFGGRGSSVLLSGFLPMFWAAVLADTFGSRTQGVEGRPARRLGLLDVGLFLGVTGAAAVLYAGVVVAGPWVDGVGPLLITSGTAVVVSVRRTAASAVFVVCAVVLGTSVYGVDAPGARFVRLLQGDGDPRSSFAVGILVCGAGCWVLASTRVNTRLRGSCADP